MVSAPYECPIYFSSLVAKWSIYRSIFHLQTRVFIFPLPSVNYGVDLHTLQVSKSDPALQELQFQVWRKERRTELASFSTVLAVFVLYLSLSGCYFTYCLISSVAVYGNLTGLLAEARKYSLPAAHVCAHPYSPHQWTWCPGSCISGNSVSLLRLCSQKPPASATAMLRKGISDREFTCFGRDPSRFGCDCISTLLMVPLALSKWKKAHL